MSPVAMNPAAMNPVADSALLRGIGTYPAGEGASRSPAGLAGSVGLHVLVLLLLAFGLPRGAPPPPAEHVVPIDLVQLGEETASPPAAIRAPLPQEQAKEVAERDAKEAVPPAQMPAPQALTHPAEKEAAPRPLLPPKPEPKSRIPALQAPKPDPALAAKQQKAEPADALSTQLALLSKLRQDAPPVPPSPRQQDGSGASNLGASSADARPGADATYGVRDFIRAQVERRWNPDSRKFKPNWVVAIHIVLLPDGSVSLAEVVNERRYGADPTYLDFARSARNAVLLSSPIVVPPGKYDIARDIVIEFDPKRVSR